MNDETKNGKISEEEIALFREAVKKLTAIKRYKTDFQPEAFGETKFSDFQLSDPLPEDLTSAEQILFYSKTGLSPKQIRRLKQGKIMFSATLDLHGFTVERARYQLIKFIEYAYQHNKRCIKIVHGKGHTKTPILKSKINYWLKQFDTVLAFCSALPKDGGTGALYVLLRAQT